MSGWTSESAVIRVGALVCYSVSCLTSQCEKICNSSNGSWETKKEEECAKDILMLGKKKSLMWEQTEAR